MTWIQKSQMIWNFRCPETLLTSFWDSRLTMDQLNQNGQIFPFPSNSKGLLRSSFEWSEVVAPSRTLSAQLATGHENCRCRENDPERHKRRKYLEERSNYFPLTEARLHQELMSIWFIHLASMNQDIILPWIKFVNILLHLPASDEDMGFVWVFLDTMGSAVIESVDQSCFCVESILLLKKKNSAHDSDTKKCYNSASSWNIVGGQCVHRIDCLMIKQAKTHPQKAPMLIAM